MDPTQLIRDPATGAFVEGRWVCPACKLVNGSSPVCSCGVLRPGEEPIAVDDDDTDDTDLFTPDRGGSD